VLLPLAAEGQEARPAATPRSATVRPVDVVAERVRSILFGDPNRSTLVELAEIIPETSIGTSERVAATVAVPATDASDDVVADAESAAVTEAAELEAPIATSDVADVPAADVLETDVPAADVLASDVLGADVPAIDAPAATDLPADDVLAGTTTAGEVLDVVAMGPAWTSETPVLSVPNPPEPAASFVDRLRTVNVETLFRLIAGIFALVAMATLLRRRGEGMSLKPARGPRRGPVVDARSLVAKGVPLDEVTRRTGLGRDALALLAHRKAS